MKTLKYYIKELIKIYSNEKSFFSKKRIESGSAFVIAQIGMIVYFANRLPTISISDFCALIIIEFGIAGYLINKTEKNKNITNNDNE